MTKALSRLFAASALLLASTACQDSTASLSALDAASLNAALSTVPVGFGPSNSVYQNTRSTPAPASSSTARTSHRACRSSSTI